MTYVYSMIYFNHRACRAIVYKIFISPLLIVYPYLNRLVSFILTFISVNIFIHTFLIRNYFNIRIFLFVKSVPRNDCIF